MCRYRLVPTFAQARGLAEHCRHARYVWNLAVEQHSWWHPGRRAAPGNAAQGRQLTEARRAFPWLAAGSVMVQQQALRDFAQAMSNYFAGTHRRPTWRKSGRHDGFQIVHVTARNIRRVSRRVGQVRRSRIRAEIARLTARQRDARKNWVETVSTDLARRFDVIRVEALNVRAMTRSARGTVTSPGRNVRQKAGLNRGILAAGWGMLVTRLKQKAPGRVEKIKPAFTSQICSSCGHHDAESRESQARFRCRACGLAINADVNAAMNIAAGRAVTARGGAGLPEPANREPQLVAS